MLEMAPAILSFEANFALDVKLCLCCTFGSSAPLNLQDKECLKHQLEENVLYLLGQKFFSFLVHPSRLVGAEPKFCCHLYL